MITKQYALPAFPRLLHGGDYNPEQWQDRPDILEEDMRLMTLAHINSATVGIFSWAELEPEEGKFDFTFLDETMDRLHRIGAKVILATPSGSRPRWLAQAYPEVLRMDAQGHREHYGNRHNHCFTSPIYREKVGIINRRLAARYQNHPALLLWHVSNEYNGECRCPLCIKAFQDYVKEQFHGDLELLNHEWWAHFWAHRYTSWDQIEPGDFAVNGLELTWKRFVTHQTVSFLKAEMEPLRELTPHIPVTTNFMPVWGLDYREIAREVDVISWDNYPYWHKPGEEISVAVKSAFWQDYFRSLKQHPFLLMESTPSNANWAPCNKLKRPGMHRLASLQAIAHGSDSVQYFQWRQSRGSCEKLHGAVVSHQGTEHTRVFREVAALGETLQKLEDVAGCTVPAEVGILLDTSSLWALEASPGFCRQGKGYEKTLLTVYHAFWKQGINVDILFPDSDFTPYRLIAAPMLYMTPQPLIDKLAAYVSGGGTLLGGYITGLVNENDLCWLGGFPGGALKDVFGLWAEETDTLYPEESNGICFPDGTRYDAIDYCEVVHPSTAETLAVFESDYYRGMPALCKNKYRNGAAYYMACRDRGDVTDRICRTLTKALSLTVNLPVIPPDGVTAHTRTDGEMLTLFLENYTDRPQEITVGAGYQNAETQSPLPSSLTLPPFGCVVAQKKSKKVEKGLYK